MGGSFTGMVDKQACKKMNNWEKPAGGKDI